MPKILVTVDDSLLVRLDREAKLRGLSRSKYLSRLVEQHLDLASGPGQRSSVRNALNRLDRLFAQQPWGEEAARAVRQDRDSH